MKHPLFVAKGDKGLSIHKRQIRSTDCSECEKLLMALSAPFGACFSLLVSASYAALLIIRASVPAALRTICLTLAEAVGEAKVHHP